MMMLAHICRAQAMATVPFNRIAHVVVVAQYYLEIGTWRGFRGRRVFRFNNLETAISFLQAHSRFPLDANVVAFLILLNPEETYVTGPPPAGAPTPQQWQQAWSNLANWD